MRSMKYVEAKLHPLHLTLRNISICKKNAWNTEGDVLFLCNLN